MKNWIKQYKDDSKGAKKFIKEQTCFKITKKTKVFIDPEVEGVWKVTNLEDPASGRLKVYCIIYMAGYKEPFGNIRKYNDFEDDCV